MHVFAAFILSNLCGDAIKQILGRAFNNLGPTFLHAVALDAHSKFFSDY